MNEKFDLDIYLIAADRKDTWAQLKQKNVDVFPQEQKYQQVI